MRTLEVGLEAIRKCLQIAEPRNPNWGNTLRPINDWLAKVTKSHKEHAFFDEIYGRLDIVRRAWRNNTMHVENIYSQEDARILLDATSSLMRRIAARMDENGQPYALVPTE